MLIGGLSAPLDTHGQFRRGPGGDNAGPAPALTRQGRVLSWLCGAGRARSGKPSSCRPRWPRPDRRRRAGVGKWLQSRASSPTVPALARSCRQLGGRTLAVVLACRSGFAQRAGRSIAPAGPASVTDRPDKPVHHPRRLEIEQTTVMGARLLAAADMQLCRRGADPSPDC